MIFIDSNIPMYLVGAPHPLKDQARRLLDQCISRRERLVTDAETLQEILHRYAAIRRLDAIQPAFDAILEVVDEVFDIERGDIERAKETLLRSRSISARDALHVAVMTRTGTDQILTFDRGFDEIEGIKRLTLAP